MVSALRTTVETFKNSLKSNLDSSLAGIVKKPSTSKTPAKKTVVPGDSIDDDVRKIKEFMKKVSTPTSAKPRETAKSTPTGRASRSNKKEEETTAKKELAKVEEKPKVDNELKNKLLADWDDDDDADDKKEGKFTQIFNF